MRPVLPRWPRPSALPSRSSPCQWWVTKEPVPRLIHRRAFPGCITVLRKAKPNFSGCVRASRLEESREKIRARHRSENAAPIYFILFFLGYAEQLGGQRARKPNVAQDLAVCVRDKATRLEKIMPALKTL